MLVKQAVMVEVDEAKLFVMVDGRQTSDRRKFSQRPLHLV